MGWVLIIICLIPVIQFAKHNADWLFVIALLNLFINIISYVLMVISTPREMRDLPTAFQSPLSNSSTILNLTTTAIGVILLIISFFV